MTDDAAPLSAESDYIDPGAPMCACGHTRASHTTEGCFGCDGDPCDTAEPTVHLEGGPCDVPSGADKPDGTDRFVRSPKTLTCEACLDHAYRGSIELAREHLLRNDEAQWDRGGS